MKHTNENRYPYGMLLMFYRKTHLSMHMTVPVTINPLLLQLKPKLIQYPRMMLTVHFPQVMFLYRIRQMKLMH